MLKTRAPFPHPDSYGLIRDGDQLRAVRLIERRVPGMVTISFVDQPSASGRRQVLAAELLDADPLCPEEQTEVTELRARLRGRKANRDRADVARLESLTKRATLAPILDAALQARDEAERRAARSARYAQRRDDLRRGILAGVNA